MELPPRSLKKEVALKSVNLTPDDGEWNSLDDIIASSHDPVVNCCYFELYRFDTKPISGKHAPSDFDWFDNFADTHD
ncbi:hypothetical protein DPMN_030279 [Dreissena polymorpha]|uniref:Uncharacterized protein n=1 Tax=Dreissena polymorpha TaxID=45954 RepID=A0A9D4M044_DREPO|nr:hypothetical protein DPMN_030279 [Dreissena polymorpha]